MIVDLSAALGVRFREIREHYGTQDDVVLAARHLGLRWSRSRVADLEAGQKPLSIEEAFLLMAIVEMLSDGQVKPSDLIGEVGLVALSPSTSLDSHELMRKLHLGQPVVEAMDIQQAEQHTDRVVTDGPRLTALGITDQASLVAADGWAAEAEAKAARALDEPVSVILGLAHQLWGTTLSERRDKLLADALGADEDSYGFYDFLATGVPTRTIQAKRGRITRRLLDQLREERNRRDANAQKA